MPIERPKDPKALLAAVDAATGQGYEPSGVFGSSTPRTPADREFQFLSELLWNAHAAAPASAEAAVFHALATIPGVSAEANVTDAGGDAAISVMNDGGAHELLLAPSGYGVLGLRSVSTGTAPLLPSPANSKAASKAPPAGTVIESLAWTAVRPVSAPGQR